jgi:hypothetical protein
MQKMTQIEFNKLAILNAMREAGIDSAVIDYQGGGDSGDVVDLAFSASGEPCDDIPTTVKIKRHHVTWDTTTKITVTTEIEVECTLREALHDFLWSCVDADGHAGWENNDGGFGRLTLDCGKNICTLVHSQNVVTTEDYSREF